MNQNIHTRSNIQFILAACILIGTVSMSCRNNQYQSNSSDPTAYRTPVAKPFEFTEPKQIEWEVTDPDSMDIPQTYPLNIDKMPSQPFSINEFEPLKSSIEESPWDMDSKKRVLLQFDTIPAVVKTSVLPTPIVTRMGRPQILEGTSSGLLQLSTNEGLPSNEIRKIIQNEDGTYWIATFEGGLCLYDGNELYTYNYTLIWDFVIDQDGKLWVATANNGIYVLDFKNKTETHFLSNTTILRLHCDHQNKIWIIHWRTGTYIMDSEMKHLRQITNPGFERGFPITEDRDHNIWLSHRSDGQSVICVIGKNREDYTDILTSGAGNFYLDSDNRMWITNGTDTVAISIENKTVTTLNGKNGFIGAATLHEEDDHGRLWIIRNDTIQVLSKDHTQMKTIVTNSPVSLPQKFGCSIKDDRGVIWIGTLTKGILLVDPDGPFPEHLDVSNGLIDPALWAMEEDSRGNIWLVTESGINIYDPTKKEIIALNHDVLKTGRINGRPVMQSLKEYEKDKFFIDGVRGFTIIDRSKNELTRHCENQWIALRSNGLLIDEKNDLWVATNRGLAVYNLESNQMKFIRNRSDQFPGNRSIDLIEDSQGHYWVATDAGLVIINPKENSMKYLREQEGLCNNEVMKLLLTENGHLWVATTNGVSIINIANQKITNLGEDEGLIPDEVYDLQEKEGTLYIGSVNGLIQVKPSSDLNFPWNFYNYSAAQGFPSNDYKQDASLLRSNGQLWFGTGPIDKLTILTQDPVPDTIPCSVSITGLSIMDVNPSFESMASLQPYVETGDTLWSSDGNKIFTANTLPKDSGYVFENNIQWDSLSSFYKMPIGLKLPYNQNYLRFRYSNQCVMNRDAITNRYMLEGVDDEWLYSGQEFESKNYFNLSSGAYTFKVATKSITGKWGDPIEFSFQIIPPWWRTWWAYLGYALLAMGGIWAIVQFRSRRLQRENRLLEEKVSYRTKKLRESINTLKETQAQLVHSEKMASLGELTAGIAHEIQNPLNFVNNFSEVNAELTKELEEEIEKGDLEEAKAIAKDIKENEEKIMYHGKRAESIVKGMLQHSRSSSGEKLLTDINALADEYLRLAYHGFRAKDKSFNSKFETDFDETLEKIFVVPQEIGRVMLNLITNAFHAVREKSVKGETKDGYQPSVSVKTKKQDGQVLIEVSDNGSGMPAEVKNKIFQPFFTTKPTGEGTGLGLSMSFDIIKLHKGKISVDSVEGEGTTFHITLPIANPN